MLVRPLLTACFLGGLFPLLSQAQTPPATSRFYMGVGATLYSNVPFQTTSIVPHLLGPSLLAGWQFTPRLAGQAGLSYHWATDFYASPSSSPPLYADRTLPLSASARPTALYAYYARGEVSLRVAGRRHALTRASAAHLRQPRSARPRASSFPQLRHAA
jgi:hypothetical protein